MPYNGYTNSKAQDWWTPTSPFKSFKRERSAPYLSPTTELEPQNSKSSLPSSKPKKVSDTDSTVWLSFTFQFSYVRLNYLQAQGSHTASPRGVCCEGLPQGKDLTTPLATDLYSFPIWQRPWSNHFMSSSEPPKLRYDFQLHQPKRNPLFAIVG